MSEQFTEEQIKEQFTKEQIKVFEGAFKRYEENNCGFITIEDLRTMMSTYDPDLTADELQKMIDELPMMRGDADQNRTINFYKFLNFMAQIPNVEDTDDEELMEAFNAIDKNKDGFIAVENLRDLMARLGKELTDKQVDEMIQQPDVGGHGQLNLAKLGKELTDDDKQVDEMIQHPDVKGGRQVNYEDVLKLMKNGIN